MSDPTQRIDVEDVTAAGDFSTWLAATRRALEGDAGIDVPCGTCTACCTASYFIHVRPDETRTLAHIPKELLFPAPGMPKGHLVMGYDQNGHCPMLVDNTCSIYEDRPQTCRSYDCRVFPATCLEPEDKPLIMRRARSWRFDHPTKRDRDAQAAVAAAVAFLREHADAFPNWVIPKVATQLAVLAIKASGAFAQHDGRSVDDIAAAVVAEVRRFDVPSSR
jgi:uncharacterized protein